METRSKTEFIGGAYYGISLAYFGKLDAAFEYLNKACNDLDTMLLTFKYSPYVPNVLRKDARFENILARVGFPK